MENVDAGSENFRDERYYRKKKYTSVRLVLIACVVYLGAWTAYSVTHWDRWEGVYKYAGGERSISLSLERKEDNYLLRFIVSGSPYDMTIITGVPAEDMKGREVTLELPYEEGELILDLYLEENEKLYVKFKTPDTNGKTIGCELKRYN